MSFQPKRVLLTGGAGFIGSHLARAWEREGVEVVVLDSLRTGSEKNLEGLKCRFVRGDVRDVALLREAMEGCEAVHHLAAMVSVPESMENPREAEEINAGGTLAVLDAAKGAGVRKVVLSSTCAVYGFAERLEHRETDLPEPASPYAISKLTAEHYMKLYNDEFGVPTVALRYFNVYGPGQDPNSAYAAAVAAFASRARANQPLTIYGDGEQTRDFVFVEDVVRANIAAARGEASGLFNVGCGEQLTINRLARQIVEACDSRSKIEHAPPRAGDVRHSRANIDRTRGELGWEPTVSVAEGLRATIESFAAG